MGTVGAWRAESRVRTTGYQVSGIRERGVGVGTVSGWCAESRVWTTGYQVSGEGRSCTSSAGSARRTRPRRPLALSVPRAPTPDTPTPRLRTPRVAQPKRRAQRPHASCHLIPPPHAFGRSALPNTRKPPSVPTRTLIPPRPAERLGRAPGRRREALARRTRFRPSCGRHGRVGAVGPESVGRVGSRGGGRSPALENAKEAARPELSRVDR